jgi:BED zinc finger.
MALPSSSFAPSIYSDNIDPLLSNCFSVPPSNVPESYSTAPVVSSLLPPSLRRVGGRRKEWALWSEMTKTEFIEWWLTTQYATTLPNPGQVHWDGVGQSSKAWECFDQVANITSGEPKVLCRRCGDFLQHPWRHGPSGMSRHLKKDKCKEVGRQANIQLMMAQRAVSSDEKGESKAKVKKNTKFSFLF